MADYHIGLDFGTSQTKVCLLNKNTEVREFIKFDNGKYFLPSLIVLKTDNTFSYGDENENGSKYRYFKMASAEDEELIQITNENLDGNIENGTIDDYRKYSTDYHIKPDILVVLFLSYTYLFIKHEKTKQNIQNLGGLLGRLTDKKVTTQNTFSINLGIPTEWNNPNHLKRKIKFQSLLITSIELAHQFDSLDAFLKTNERDLMNKISDINNFYLSKIDGKVESEKADQIKEWLVKNRLSVFPESAAGVNYLLKTRRLANGSYATLDIGAGTSDIAMFQVNDNRLKTYYCSESSEIASNDFYREYAKQLHNKDIVTFDEIKEAENIIRNGKNINVKFCNNAKKSVKGYQSSNGIEFAVRKTFFRKYYQKLFLTNQVRANNVKNNLNESPIIVFGGGANLEGFCNGNYYFFIGSNPFGYQDKCFIARPITDFVKQVEISDNHGEIQKYINLLVLALGLTYGEESDDIFNFVQPQVDFQQIIQDESVIDRYFYYDIQDAVYK